MHRSSKNIFRIDGDIISISHPDWDFVAHASVQDDYKEEIQSVTWSKKGKYLYNEKLGGYLHVYIMRKWYGNQVYEQMKANNYVIDHMDSNGYNCHICNLCFLLKSENTAKGLTVDKINEEKAYIALTMFKDFSTQLIQSTIVFNYPAIAKISNLDVPAIIELVYLLYDCDYELVINDTRAILYNYRKNYTFEPEKLHHIDYHIEGAYGIPWSKEKYDSYIRGALGEQVAFMVRKAPMFGWNASENRRFIHLR